MTGPITDIAKWADEDKHRQIGETFDDKCYRIAYALSDDERHFDKCYDILSSQRFLPAGRVQSGVGGTREVTAFNCYVMRKVPDDFLGIMQVATEAGQTMRMGGGVGYDFSDIRPRGDMIKTLQSHASGPVSFMQIMNAVCGTISSAGHRRGAQMATLRVDHPDIEEFITAKNNSDKLTNFNMSVLVTDEFMRAVKEDREFFLQFRNRLYRSVNARALWDKIMHSTWDWAEPGVIFIDRINQMNNLWYCEDISATNPCGEQPLPAYGACLLGSFNLTKYVDFAKGVPFFAWNIFFEDIPEVVRMMDNVIDETMYPLEEQDIEAKSKRRMGLGITGLANVLEILGMRYGSEEANHFLIVLMKYLANAAYKASANLAEEKGSFPLYDETKYLASEYIQRLSDSTVEIIREKGIRNSHLISIAPTGTISLGADNVSSGIEPVFSHDVDRTVITKEGPEVMRARDYALMKWGVHCITADKITAQEHVDVLAAAQYYCDSSVSKTCNIGDNVTFEDFKDVYMQAYDRGAKGCTTFRAAGKRFGILNAVQDEEGTACYVDPESGNRTCE